MLLSAVLGTFLLTMAAAGYFIVLSGSFNAIKSGGEAMQAHRYAEIEANKLSLLAYDELDSKIQSNKWIKSDVDDNWEYNIKLESEKILSSLKNSKQRIATVSVRKVGDSTERFQMRVPVFYKEEGSFKMEDGYIKFSNGLIIQYGFGQQQYGEGLQRFYFKKPFPKECLSVTIGSAAGEVTAMNDAIYQYISHDRESVLVFKQGFYGSSNGHPVAPSYIAIGR